MPTRETFDAAVDILRTDGQPFDVPVRGRSMYPLLREGDRVVVMAGIDPVPGSLLVFRRGQILVVHRVLAAGEGDVEEIADATAARSRVPESEIVGRVTALRFASGRQVELSRPFAALVNRVVFGMQRALLRMPSALRRRGWYAPRLLSLALRVI